LVLVFKDEQTINGKTFNEVIFVQERNEYAEMWTGKRLGVEGTQDALGFRVAYNGGEFSSYEIDFSKFDKILFENFKNDVRDHINEEADLYDLIRIFKEKISFDLKNLTDPTTDKIKVKTQKRIDTKSLGTIMASMREVKTRMNLYC